MSANKPSFLSSDLDIAEGTMLGNSYKVEAFLGEGSFGFVTKCLNTKTDKAVAIKVNKNHPRILQQAKSEIFILEQLQCLDPDRCNIVKWNGFFLDRERICLNFELLDQSLSDYIKDRNNKGLPISEVKPILYQLANALSHLSSIGIVHTDLKPDNVMVVDRHQSPIKVKIIDFGLACPVSALLPHVLVQSLWYRAPEVMICAPFNQAIDMWSLGLIAAEMAIGWPLYPGQTDFEVLRFIIDTQGQPPDCVLDRGFNTHYFFLQENCSDQRWRFISEEQYEIGFPPQERYIKFKHLDDLEEIMQMKTGRHSGQELLVSLIKQMLHLDANQRITPSEALRHSFFEPGLSQTSSRDPCIDIENTEDQSLVLSLQPSYCQSKSPHSINCSVQNPVELSGQTSLSTSSVLPNDLDIVEGTILGNSYKVEAFLGEGSFGYVTKCINTQTNKAVAIKVNKNEPEFLEQAKSEIFILEQLQCLDPDRCNIVKWNGFFLDRGHICLNFELLDQSLLDYIKDRNNQGLPISELRPILYQLTNALSHLSSMGIVHADLKPDNLMVVDRYQSPIKVKIIDFGLACPVSSLDPRDYVQTIWRRAPEVMLCAPFNQAIDMWSLGLMAAEMAIGRPLYPGDTEFDVLTFIIRTQGQPPDCVLDCGFNTEQYFIQEYCGSRCWRFKSEEEFQDDTGYQMRETRHFKLKSLDDLEQLMKQRTGHHSGQDLLVSLIKQMLHLDYNQRITPLEALRHPFFDLGPSQSSIRDPCIDIENTEDQSLVLSLQPSYCQSKSPHSIDYSVQNTVESPGQTSLKMSVNKPSFLPRMERKGIAEGTMLGNSYKVEAFLGEGSFGFVTKCLNTKTDKAVAIKVNKNHPRILQQAKSEIFILEQLQCLDPDRCNIVKWNGFFLDGERICLNFELLDQSLSDYIKDRNNKGLPISEVKPILYQLANALSHLSSIGIVHTDLKPDNVMVVDRHQSPIKVKIIDFGLACPVSALLPHVLVQSLWYRAPEVMICAPFNQAIDMWSLGLIAAEMAIGWPLYPGQTDFEVLRFIIDTQGQPPDCVLDRGFNTHYFFLQENCSDQRWRFISEEQYEIGFPPQERYIKSKHLDDLDEIMQMKTGRHSGQELLVSLIKQMLHLDANQRITPSEALRHPFFEPGLSQTSSRDPCIDIENTEDQSLVLSLQPSYCQSKSPHSIDCSVQNPVELSGQTSLSTSSVLPNDLDIVEGTILGNSYKVEAFLGEGSFGYVTKCINTQTNKAVAIKVNKNEPEFLEQAKSEIFILEQLQCLDPDRCNIVKWNGFFLDRGHICLNFELLDQSLLDYIKDRNNQGLPISELRPILYQLTNALSHLSSMGIVHADLKPDNLMVVDRYQSPIKVKIIDFGLACPVSSLDPRDYVQTIWHRAPEVMLCAPFNQAIDMWSLGLIAVEMAIGRPLYPGETEFDVLTFIIRTQGQPPDCVLDCGFNTEQYFIQEYCGSRCWRFKCEEEFQDDTGYQMRETRHFKLKSLDDLEQLMKKRTGHHSGQDLLVSLIKQMLHLDYNQRITPLEALRHPFFDPGLSQSSIRDPCIDIENTEVQSLVFSQPASYCNQKAHTALTSLSKAQLHKKKPIKSL